MSAQNAYGSLLRSWRQTRRLSQLDLALASGASQRHVSFLESGRSRPSRGMALTLGSVLRVPLKEQNLMLLAAGFAPAFSHRELASPERRTVDEALVAVIHQQDPFPAILLKGGNEIMAANRGATRLVAFLNDGPATTRDLGQLFFGPGGIGRHLENADEVLAWADRRARAERILNMTPSQTLDDAGPAPRRESVEATTPAVSLRFAKDGVRLSLYTLLASLGTPLDIGVEQMGLEFFLPADAATTQWFKDEVP